MESKKEKGENRIFVHVNMRRLGVQDGCSPSSDCIYPIHVMLLLLSVAAQEKLRADEWGKGRKVKKYGQNKADARGVRAWRGKRTRKPVGLCSSTESAAKQDRNENGNTQMDPSLSLPLSPSPTFCSHCIHYSTITSIITELWGPVVTVVVALGVIWFASLRSMIVSRPRKSQW